MQYRQNGYAAGAFDTFYFEKNLQGDIIAVYNASGTKLVGYTYDAWGNCTTTYYNGGASTGAQYNPFRYRGYYYDADLGWYYLNSRYYDSNTGRFINADSYVSTGQGILGYNPFAYCRNEPVFRKDTLGTSDVCIDIFDDNNPLNDLGGNFFGCGGGGAGGASAYYGYDSSAYGTYLTKSATANYDAALGGYYSGGGSSYNIGNYIVPGAITVTDNMATSSHKNDSTKKTYTPPPGGGGITDTIVVNDITVTFGHGGRHLTQYNGNVGELNYLLAKDVITQPMVLNTRMPAAITYNGLTIEYGYFYRSPKLVNIGSYKIFP